ncbi:AarF/UbiB family protein [Pontibacillus yanchengensis]|uniref:Kinase n=1 Tax=Pontibacillus yanchengensis Y32 TaxID=1385514 RepID=A0A0A2TDB9_9BACI|nr:lipopolysaccharide kinase InaA family protein [Pontibacillus yanchengensis]KGP72393.1 kinase [Pontibacillus yanchengensis Y32]
MIDFKKKNHINKQDLVGYKLIGDGKDGEIYQITEEKCVKYFFKEETQQKELEALKVGQISPVFPRLYEYGDNYIVMEYVEGVSLARHLKREKQITRELTAKVVAMLQELQRVGFTRWDTEIRHILIDQDQQLKVIDHKRAFSTNTHIPTKLFKGLKKYDVLDAFLEHVKEMDASSYQDWVNKK